jgi:hypothetical protein
VVEPLEHTTGSPRIPPFLARAGVDDAEAARSKVAVFRCFLLALVAVELWDRSVRFSGDGADTLHLLLATLVSAGAVAVWVRRSHRIAVAVVAVALAIDFVWLFPASANHQYLQLLCLGLLLLLRDEVDDEVRFLALALRWLLLIGVFYAGLQKLVWGYYFEGEMLAFTLPQNPRFGLILQFLMPAEEFERLSKIVIQEGAGPFRVDSFFFAIASNVAYLAELVLPVMFLIPRTRRLAVWGTLAYFAAIEVAAREVFFGGIMAALALGFGPPSWLRRAQPLLYASLAVLLATSLGFLPYWFFS